MRLILLLACFALPCLAAPSTPVATIAAQTDPAKPAIRKGLSLLYAALNGG